MDLIWVICRNTFPIVVSLVGLPRQSNCGVKEGNNLFCHLLLFCNGNSFWMAFQFSLERDIATLLDTAAQLI